MYVPGFGSRWAGFEVITDAWKQELKSSGLQQKALRSSLVGDLLSRTDITLLN